MNKIKNMWLFGIFIWSFLITLLIFNITALEKGSLLEGEKFAMLLFVGGGLFLSLIFGGFSSLVYAVINRKKQLETLNKTCIKGIFMVTTPWILVSLILLGDNISWTLDFFIIMCVSLAIVFTSIVFSLFCSLFYIYLQMRFEVVVIKGLFIVLTAIYLLTTLFMIMLIITLVGIGGG